MPDEYVPALGSVSILAPVPFEAGSTNSGVIRTGGYPSARGLRYPIPAAYIVTAYLDRGRAESHRTVGEVAWGSVIWFASEPDRLLVASDGLRSRACATCPVGDPHRERQLAMFWRRSRAGFTYPGCRHHRRRRGGTRDEGLRPRQRPVATCQRHGVHGVSKRSNVFRIALRFAELAWGQNLLVDSLYSTWKAAFPAARNGSSFEHSLYCSHCSFTV